MELSSTLNLMEFPPEWVGWNVLPIDSVTAQAKVYSIGDEQGSEHDRHGVFECGSGNIVHLRNLSCLHV